MKPLFPQSIRIFSRLHTDLPEAEIRRLIQGMMRREKRWPGYEINIHFIDNTTIRKLKRKYFGIRRITDVISLDYSTIPGLLEGEIFISVETAQKQAMQYGVAEEQELSRLIAHGMLHLLGHDDANEKQRAAMSRLEDRILARKARSRKRKRT